MDKDEMLDKLENDKGFYKHNNYKLVDYKDEEFVEIFANLDINNDNYLGYEDFVRGVIDKNNLLNDNILEYAFRHFD